MGRMSSKELNALKMSVDLVSLVSSKGVKLKIEGKDHVGLCPLHDDKTASLRVTPSKGLWHCFGCNKGGSAIDWLIESEGVSFKHALEVLQSDSFKLSSVAIKNNTIPLLKNPLSLDADSQKLLEECVDFYHETLLKEKNVLDYLKKRKLDSEELIKTFKLGFSNRTLGLRLPFKNRKDGSVLRKNLQSIGILRQSGHEHFAGSLIVPVFDKRGEVSEVYGRKINDHLRVGTAYHLYLPGEHKGIFNRENLLSANVETLILCEALIDALSFYKYGFKNVTTSFGVAGFTDELFEFITSKPFKRVIVAYDNDEAGRKAADVLAEKLNAEGVEVKFFKQGESYDINRLVVESNNERLALEDGLKYASFIGEGSLYSSSNLGSKSFPLVASLADKPLVEVALKEETKTAAKGEVEALEPVVLDKENLASKYRKGDAFVFELEGRTYRILGLERNHSLSVMKVNIKVSESIDFHIDTLDMYLSKSRLSFIKQASIELGVDVKTLKNDLGQLLNLLEQIQEELESEILEEVDKKVEISREDKEEALSLLKEPFLLSRLLSDLDSFGVIGEEHNKIIAYLCTVSRKLSKPLGLIIQSTSAGGKSSLLDAILELVPEEEQVKYSSMSGQSLFYMGENSLKNKVLCLEEEEGGSRASYSLKILQSAGKLSMASTGKDEKTGKLVTMEYTVEGPVQLAMTTTSIELDPELQNRCLILSVDESKAQTERIHQLQREGKTRQGMIRKRQVDKGLRVWQNAGRMLESIEVVNEYATDLTFVSDKTRTRRDQLKYLTLIDTIALLHQHQKVKREDDYGVFIEVSLDDIELANRLSAQAFGRTLDELPPQTRKLLDILFKMSQEEVESEEEEGVVSNSFRFSRRKVREYCHWSDTQLKVHLARLVELEYLLVHRASRGGQSFEYELMYQGGGNEGEPFFMGLLDVKELIKKHPTHKYDSRWSGFGEGWSA